MLDLLPSEDLKSHAIRHNGRRREALVYYPDHLRRRCGVPLVLAFHGGASSPEAFAERSAFHKLAAREGFAVAYPRGLQGNFGCGWCPTGSRNARKIDDVGFARALLDDLQRAYHIDTTRIFATGFSIGGSLVYELACAMSDEIAAIAVVSGSMTTCHCKPARPVSLLHIHGTEDEHVPAEGGRGVFTRREGAWRPAEEAVGRWRAINGCAAPSQTQTSSERGVTRYVSRGDADVELLLVDGCDHTWPGSVPGIEDAVDLASDSDFCATTRIWSFFKEHPRRRSIAWATG